MPAHITYTAGQPSLNASECNLCVSGHADSRGGSLYLALRLTRDILAAIDAERARIDAALGLTPNPAAAPEPPQASLAGRKVACPRGDLDDCKCEHRGPHVEWTGCRNACPPLCPQCQPAPAVQAPVAGQQTAEVTP